MGKAVDFIPILLGGGANAYGMARSFYEEYRVESVVLTDRAYPICQTSRIVQVKAENPDLRIGLKFRDALQDFARQPEYAGRTLLLVPCEERFARLLVRYQGELSESYRFNVPRLETAAMLETKMRFYEVAKRHGLSCPYGRAFTTDAAIGFDSSDFPLVLKPDDPVAYETADFRGKKNMYDVRGPAELDFALSTIFSSGYSGAMVVQEAIEGTDEAMRTFNCYCDSQGRVRLICQGDVVLEETAPWNIGSFGAVVAGHDEELTMAVASFLEEIGYTGFASLDAKYDERSHTFHFLDFDLLQNDSAFLATVSGKNLAHFLVQDVLEGEEGYCEIVEQDAAMLSQLPESTVRQYARTMDIMPRVENLMRERKYSELFTCSYDNSMRRRKEFRTDQHYFRREFADCYGRRHIND